MAAHGERFDLLLGRRTYDIWSGFWPKSPNSPMADRLNAATKYVATHRPESLEWGPCEGLGPDIVEGIRRCSSTRSTTHRLEPVPLYVSAHGLTTSRIPYGTRGFE
jgi:hypothetical protein